MLRHEVTSIHTSYLSCENSLLCFLTQVLEHSVKTRCLDELILLSYSFLPITFTLRTYLRVFSRMPCEGRLSVLSKITASDFGPGSLSLKIQTLIGTFIAHSLSEFSLSSTILQLSSHACFLFGKYLLQHILKALKV